LSKPNGAVEDKFYGHTFSGSLAVDDPAYLRLWCSAEDGPVEISIKRVGPRKSLDQLGYYFGTVCRKVAVWISEELKKIDPQAAPVLKDEAHEALKRKHLGSAKVLGLDVVRSIKKFSSTQMTAYLDSILADFDAIPGKRIPRPNEPDKEVF
jgi:hypothetical protein